MTNEQFKALVLQLEGQARRKPKSYQLRVMLLALLGNAYLTFVLLLTTALFLGLLASIMVLKWLAFKLILIVGVFLWMLLKALWISLPPPEGLALKAKDAPDLFKMIAELRKSLRAPRFHRVLLTDDFNAGVVQIPRLGLFGWHLNYLLIGLPLLKSLSVEQFKAVLAHEFGHLAKGHGHLSNWVYRQRLRWDRLMQILETNQSAGRWLFKPFFNWYAPYFNAYSFPLARANEYEADATSARLTSPQTAAEALTCVSVVGSFLEERFWPDIYKQASDSPQPGLMPYTNMGQQLARGLDETAAETWLEQAMARETTLEDTHPALADRLRALGENPRLAPPEADQTADRLLGGQLAAITETFDLRWRGKISPAWEERHREVQAGRRRLAELDEQAQGAAGLPLQNAFERARLTESVGDGPDAALAQFHALHEREPGNPFICFNLGTRLLTRGEEAGCALLEQAMALDEDATPGVCEALRDYHWRAGRKELAQDWHQRLLESTERRQAGEQERSQVLLKDTFEPHGLSEEALVRFRAQLQAIPGLRHAYLLKKRVKYAAHRPFYVLGYTIAGFFQFHSPSRAAAVLRQIKQTVEFPGETMIFNVEGDNYRFGQKFKKIKGAKIV